MILCGHKADRNKKLGWYSSNVHCFTITAKASQDHLGAASDLVPAVVAAAAVAVVVVAAAAVEVVAVAVVVAA